MKNVSKALKNNGVNSLYAPGLVYITKKNNRLRKIQIDKIKKSNYKTKQAN
jgi:hypothetical protein